MDDTSRMILAIAARVLSYPDESFSEEICDIQKWIDEEAPNEIKKDLCQALGPIFRSSLRNLKELYVTTFDLKEKTGLYLTAQELGDSRKRGAALIKLQKMINEAGFERDDGELADFMPMLYEFLAVAEDSSQTKRLIHRLASATKRVKGHLEKDNPYHPVLNLLMDHVFPAPTKEELEQVKRDREGADLDKMPYPLMYDDGTGS